ncbi:glycosyltransferase [Asticcacaulis sp. DW145]|uniref:glycosyltransferase family 2 protein n=1 Tax=Asticcacaulis sp. DW145 TaxID=3095608 RepID=UPI00308B679C|nr:glycosyltransferase [Asticcacaulis sp. DW145]
MKISIGIATAGRPALVGRVVRYLEKQTLLPSTVYVCPAKSSDFDPTSVEGLAFPVVTVRGAIGLPAQRNLILDAGRTDDVILFIDDDFLPESDFLFELNRLFEDDPTMVLATGHVVADGATGPGLSFEDADAIISQLPLKPSERLESVYNAYGCNMAVRVRTARGHDVRFDEVLPLYAWWEDVDFSRRLAPFGKIIKSNRLRGVHMGSKSGRTPGVRLGYSQVANIAYLVQKGSVSFPVGAVRIGRNVFANALRQFAPEPWVDRKGRFVGNLKGLSDWMRGRVDPQRILRL